MTTETRGVERRVGARKRWNPALGTRHASAIRILGYCLKLGMTIPALQDLALVWSRRLSRPERAALLSAAIAACAERDAETLLDAALGDFRAGTPLPALGRVQEEAARWADLASLTELKAYVFEAYMHLPESVQADFLRAAARWRSDG